MSLTRRQLLVAARAAAAWPPGRRHAWFSVDRAALGILGRRTIPVAVARRWGDPAVAAAAFVAHAAGRVTVPWHEVFTTQAALLELLVQGGESLNEWLPEAPMEVAMFLEEVATGHNGREK